MNCGGKAGMVKTICIDVAEERVELENKACGKVQSASLLYAMCIK